MLAALVCVGSLFGVASALSRSGAVASTSATSNTSTSGGIKNSNLLQPSLWNFNAKQMRWDHPVCTYSNCYLFNSTTSSFNIYPSNTGLLRIRDPVDTSASSTTSTSNTTNATTFTSASGPSKIKIDTRITPSDSCRSMFMALSPDAELTIHRLMHADNTVFVYNCTNRVVHFGDHISTPETSACASRGPNEVSLTFSGNRAFSYRDSSCGRVIGIVPEKPMYIYFGLLNDARASSYMNVVSDTSITSNEVATVLTARDWVFGPHNDVSTSRKIYYSSADSHVMFDAKGAVFISFSYIAPPQLSVPIETSKIVSISGHRQQDTGSESYSRGTSSASTTISTDLLVLLSKAALTASDFISSTSATTNSTSTRSNSSSDAVMLQYSSAGMQAVANGHTTTTSIQCIHSVINTTVAIATSGTIRVLENACGAMSFKVATSTTTSRKHSTSNSTSTAPFHLYMDRACASKETLVITALQISDIPSSFWGKIIEIFLNLSVLFSSETTFYVSVSMVVPVVYFILRRYMNEHKAFKKQ